MNRALTFHVPPEARPSTLQALLLACNGSTRDTPIARAELLERMRPYLATTPRGEVLTLAQDLGLLHQIRCGYFAAPRAQALERSDCPNDLVHGLRYFAWSASNPGTLGYMWTYRLVVDLLWEQAPVKVDSHLKKRIVEEVLLRAEQAFRAVPGFDPSRTSIGPKSIDGVLRWLEATAPCILEDGIVHRRISCPPALVVTALAGVARETAVATGVEFRLASAQRLTLCKCCFLELEALDRMLDWTTATQPKVVRWGSLASTYGRQLVLREVDVWPEHFL